MAGDWFRKTTWTEEDRLEYFQKLKRAREYNKPQYLRIQAYTLYCTNEKKLLIAALDLLKKYFEEYPEDNIEKSSSYQLMGNIYCKMKKYDLALEKYNHALDFEEKFPNVQTGAYLDYSELIIQLNKVELFENVKNIILKKDGEIDFPINLYKKNAILSIIYKYDGDIEKAKFYKRLAEEAANAEETDFRWHKKLGLVKKRNKLLDKLWKIADFVKNRG
jgi:tetratricopeptide (TPR) repeat protein